MTTSKLDNPPIPLLVMIPGGDFTSGSFVEIEGEPLRNSNRFSVNFISMRRNNTCLFHFNPRFDQGVTVRNSNYPNGKWGHEERSSLPFIRGQPFMLEIVCMEDCYTVTVNGEYHCSYRHRFDFGEVDAIEVVDGVRVRKLKIESGKPQRLKFDNLMPVRKSFDDGFEIGDTVEIHGTVSRRNPGRFHVKLRSRDDNDVALHVNPRFEGGNCFVVLNSEMDGEWGYEERIDSPELYPGADFDMSIKMQKCGYDIVINGNYLTTFPFRSNPDDVDFIEIDGDVTLDEVIFD